LPPGAKEAGPRPEGGWRPEFGKKSSMRGEKSLVLSSAAANPRDDFRIAMNTL
jgi:hypothetical protein